MSRYLAVKLTLAFLLVIILGAVPMVFLVRWQTQREFDELAYNLFQDELLAARSQLGAYYSQNAGWEGLNGVVIRDQGRGRPGGGHYLPLTVVNADREVVFGSANYQPGETVPRRVINRGMPIEVDGETVGWVLLESFGGVNDPSSPEANFLERVNRATAISALGAAAAALLLGVLLASTISKPVSELQEATEQVAGGQLGLQVPVRSRDEIGQLANSFNRMSLSLAESNDLRKQMTADIAHELRTPLSVLQGYTEALDEGKLEGDADIYRAMHRQALHLTRLVEDLRTLSLADAGQLPLTRQVVPPLVLLEQSANTFKAQAEQQDVELRVDAAPDLPGVEVDPYRMAQVLDNLVSNALRYTQPGGEIRLSADASDGSLLLKVHDTGKGIAPEDLPQVFERFFRADKARPENGETGLGLAIARSIVEAHGGSIRVESAPGAGTTFVVSLPV
jgi:signal transduction histidine kinase